MIKCLAGSLKAALSLALLAGAGSVLAIDNVATLVGGDTASGDQATVALDSTVPGAFSYQRPPSGVATATAYLNSHVFCAETPRAPTQVSLHPRYQQSVTLGSDVWQFPDVYVHSFTYQGGGVGNAGAPALVIGQATSQVNKQFRCLSSFPGSSLELPNVSMGLFDSGFGGNTTPTAPSGPHQNVTVNAELFSGFSGLSVSVVKIDTQFDFSNPAGVVWTLVDGFNTSALSPLADATWCGLGTLWIEHTTPPPQLCDDALLSGTIKESGAFVRHQFSAPASSLPYYVLVYRPVVGVASAGTPIQGFAALRTGGGMVGVAEESQDWYTDDSVWYNY
ncbi:MAG TPA: hypothetical protein VFN25_13515 [Dokdonella sp.]|uniref:hypothetical protein n=1 Tax=Dokdonella sp. TaxID=2291710 RepID=UPI002D7FF7E9|nr:hypothetical protein [Dokdonella sp.]HET9033907.1 hypothetical protein [Dokdonella sp.]